MIKYAKDLHKKIKNFDAKKLTLFDFVDSWIVSGVFLSLDISIS